MAQLLVGLAYPGELVNVYDFDFGAMTRGVTRTATPTLYQNEIAAGDILSFVGTGFTYLNGVPTGGTITGIQEVDASKTVFEITGASLPIPLVLANLNNATPILTVLFGGDDSMAGSDVNMDFLHGFAGNDQLSGGELFDSLNGNTGADTVSGGGGNDWVRGGRDNDSVSGGTGNDFVSGDRGSDTVSGGAGADTFYSFGDAGVDRVIDFNRAEGDSVKLAAGSTYSAAQVGADTVILVNGSATLTLVGVAALSLTGNWLTFD